MVSVCEHMVAFTFFLDLRDLFLLLKSKNSSNATGLILILRDSDLPT